MKNIALTIVMLMLFVMRGMSQQHEIYMDNIRTLQVLVNNQWNQTPIIHLGTNDYINVSFDDLTHEYHRYRYRIELCNFDWSVNGQMFDSDYLRGENSDQPIENFRKSLNTSVLYTHYAFRFPNERVGVRISGNYRITVFDDDENEDVLSVCFSVIDDKVNVSATITTNTDIDQDRNHQQLTFGVGTATLKLNNPENEVKTVVLQNRRWDIAAINPKIDFITPSELQWKHAKNLIFKAGNEYRKFELTTMRYGTMGVNNIRWFKPYYHATLNEGKPRRNYVYDEDQDGGYFVRNQDFSDNEIQSDYAYVHFLLNADMVNNGDLYVSGDFCHDRFLEECKMSYNTEAHAYEAVILMKQGYYNYLYLFVPENTTEGVTETIEGDFYQTENLYTILVYHRPPGDRYDQLIGMREMKFMPGK